MPITRGTPFRDVGPIPFEAWHDPITQAGGRAELASRAAHTAAGKHSALLRRILKQESSYDTDYDANSPANNNPYNIRVPDYSNEGNPKGYVHFANLVDATDAARRRINEDAGFFHGPNPYAPAITIEDLLNTYAPPKWNDTEGLITAMVHDLNAWLPNWSPPVSTPSTDPEPVPGEGDQPVTAYTYDNGVAPPWVDYKVSEGAKFAGYINPSEHFIAACVVHSAYGDLTGTTSWFQSGNALTDTMVGNSLDGKYDGQIRRYNDCYGNRYAWSSGPVDNPIDDAAKFLEIFGPNKEVINMYTTAMERSCGSRVATNAVTDKEHAARVAWIAYHANRYGKRIKERTGKDGLTCDTFPLVTTENNRSFIIWHGEINADKRTSCPDPYVRQTLDRMIADVRTLLAKWQKGTDSIPPQVPPEQVPTYAPVKPIDALQAYKDRDAAPAYVDVGNDTFIFVNDRVRAIKQTPRYQSANVDGGKIGPDIEKGLEFAVLWMFWDEHGTPWYYTPYATRVLVADTERIADAA